MIFNLFLELGVGFEDDLQFFLKGLLLAVDSGGIGQIPSRSEVNKGGHLGVIEIAFS